MLLSCSFLQKSHEGLRHGAFQDSSPKGVSNDDEMGIVL